MPSNRNPKQGTRETQRGGASALVGGKRGVNEQAGTQNILLHVLTINRFLHLKMCHSHQLSLEKVHTQSQTVTRCGDEVTCEIRRGLNSSDQAELAYPP